MKLRPGDEPRSSGGRPQVRAVLGTLEREVAEMLPLRQRLPRDFDALTA